MPLTSRINLVISDLRDVLDVEELDALIADLRVEYPDYAKNSLVKVAYATRREDLLRETTAPVDKKVLLLEMQKQLADLRKLVADERQPVSAGQAERPLCKDYRLLNTDVSWTTKPQVHALMRVLSSVMKVGDTLPEDEIVRAMEMNRAVLGTKQSGRRLWDYYKGFSDSGLLQHGNIERK